MQASKPPHEAKPSSTGKPFAWAAFDVSHTLVHRLTAGLVLFTVILSGLALAIQNRLVDRQITGTERVLRSLDAERQVLEAQWAKGAVPARTLGAEQGQIQEEEDQQRAQLESLRSSHG